VAVPVAVSVALLSVAGVTSVGGAGLATGALGLAGMIWPLTRPKVGVGSESMKDCHCSMVMPMLAIVLAAALDVFASFVFALPSSMSSGARAGAVLQLVKGEPERVMARLFVKPSLDVPSALAGFCVEM
jgi:hypothetical protein